MKANPDFKWCKMPTPTTRTLLTRTKGGKGDSLRWSPDHPRAEENHAEGDLPRLPTPKGNHPRECTPDTPVALHCFNQLSLVQTLTLVCY